jgi:hypothetical protein
MKGSAISSFYHPNVVASHWQKPGKPLDDMGVLSLKCCFLLLLNVLSTVRDRCLVRDSFAIEQMAKEEKQEKVRDR